MRSLVERWSHLYLYGLVIAFLLVDPTVSQRGKRYLVYPPPGQFAPSKVQLILGLGLPMEVDVSMIIGYVMKFNYVLPHNASYLTDSFVRYDRSIDLDDSEPMKGNDTLPTDLPISDTSTEVSSDPTSRWDLYEILVSALESSPYGSKACLLRAVCEAADVPFNDIDGLAGQLLRVLFLPSTTSDYIENHTDQEYHAAELAGLRNPGQCRNIFPECPESLLEYFTEVDE